MLFSVEYRLFYRAFNKATAHGRVGDYDSDNFALEEALS